MKILVLNSGSSSQKACLYDLAGELPSEPPLPLWEGKIEWREDRAKLEVRTASGAKTEQELKRGERSESTAQLLHSLLSAEPRALAELSDIDVVGHRIVNAGRKFTCPAIVTPEVKTAIREMAKSAPLHNRIELEGITLIENECGDVPQVAVFDTGFHCGLSDATAIYPGPYEWAEHGIRKFGFHGINHQYCAGRAAQLLGRDIASLKLVTCHLGNGCSLAAVHNGKSIDTTMGFTPLDGLMMGTRSGAVDPGILTYLLRDGHTDAQALDETLNTKSGLLGISGFSGDMREIITAMHDGHKRARLAFDMFVHRLRSGIGSMIAALNGVDAIVFTGGIGENSAEVRTAASESFAFLGLGIDTEKNEVVQPDQDIATVVSKVRVLVIRAQEDWAIARECWKLRSQSANAAPTQ
jgi:acetate kinase